MYKVKIFLKSGQIVEFICEEFTVKRRELVITGLDWKTPESSSGESLQYVNLSEIAAITYSEAANEQ